MEICYIYLSPEHDYKLCPRPTIQLVATDLAPKRQLTVDIFKLCVR